jgi:hypothetical protein
MLGAGVATAITAGQHFELRLTLAWPILDAPNLRAGTPRAYLGLAYQF